MQEKNTKNTHNEVFGNGKK